MWRWLGRGRLTGEVTPPSRARFVVDEALRRRLAYWRGNVAALHRELAAAAAAGGSPAPSFATLYGRSPVTCRPGSGPAAQG
jgi:putative transposase